MLPTWPNFEAILSETFLSEFWMCFFFFILSETCLSDLFLDVFFFTVKPPAGHMLGMGSPIDFKQNRKCIERR